MPKPSDPLAPEVDVAVEDVLAAMGGGGYLDVSPADLLAVYRLAYAHAAARLSSDVPVAAIMTREVLVVPAEVTALDAAHILSRGGVSGAPVMDGERLAGVLSLRDLLRLLGLPTDAGAALLAVRLLDPATCAPPVRPGLGATPVGAVMTAPAVTIAPDATRSEAAGVMAVRGINRLPVCDGERLRGIVTRGDVARSCRGLPGGCRV